MFRKNGSEGSQMSSGLSQIPQSLESARFSSSSVPIENLQLRVNFYAKRKMSECYIIELEPIC